MNSPIQSTVVNRRVIQRRPNPLIVSVIAALALNLGAVQLVSRSVVIWEQPAAGVRTISWITAVPTGPIPSVLTLPEPTTPQTPTRHAMPIKRPAPETPPSAPAQVAIAPTSESDGDHAARYYRSNEVDGPVEPDPDWNLDAATLDAVGLGRLVFDIFIGRNGEVVNCDIVEPTDLSEETRQLLTRRLRDTVFKPALRGGAAVASVRRIEISLLPGMP